MILCNYLKNTMFFKLKYENGTVEVVQGKSALDVIKTYDLATKKHINTRIFQLEGEQEAITLSNLE